MDRKSAVIQVQKLAGGYADKVIFEKISFSIYKGEVFVILGVSGCGKSTLLKHLIGLKKPLSGSVLIDGVDMVTAYGADRLKLLRKIGVMYQSGALFGSMTLCENVRLPMEEFTDLPSYAMDLIAYTKLKLVGLESYLHFMPSEISGGMKKRAAIARALALDPLIIFLDEPTAGLDPVTASEIDTLILRLSKSFGITFVIVTHELESIFTVADRAIMLDAKTKTVIADGNPKYLRDSHENQDVRNFFNRRSQEKTN
ncbi:MAG: ATP-binding cassette domain-containing protein [Candidatus Auribacterota bacterium]|jgi:phospholipid/cholesterol/gamma-HCH transport system ATP-binding protein|nr:ATP-binding cassette domain-containing protein [Candidatus Auribacterota bacterium]